MSICMLVRVYNCLDAVGIKRNQDQLIVSEIRVSSQSSCTRIKSLTSLRKRNGIREQELHNAYQPSCESKIQQLFSKFATNPSFDSSSTLRVNGLGEIRPISNNVSKRSLCYARLYIRAYICAYARGHSSSYLYRNLLELWVGLGNEATLQRPRFRAF